ncbi:vertnin [Carlito syrichta]|uniref:Vertnin n=1 Tax=Carlito syrichta TaxID=1868482 RepID=A0A1U7TKM2_CARSF|nr:vertnin [Carlito syrichta]
MTSRDQLVQQVLRELQEAVEAEGLEGLVGAALEAKRVLSSFALPTCREGGPGPQVLEVDSVALSLYPDDAPRNMLPLLCAGEGSLLFEAASLLLRGDAGLSLELRARTVVEMLLHRHYYLQGMIDSKVMLQAVRYSLCSEECPEMTRLPPATLEAIFDADVKASCFPSSFSNGWHLYALASVLQRNIYSIYPMRNLKIRPYFNRVIRPRRCDHMPSTLHIMWAGQPLAGRLFRHQYFAPVVGLEEVEVSSPGTVLMQRAKLYLEQSISLNMLVPYRCFKRRFPGISRSTYYNWRRKALRRNPGFKPAPALPAAGTPQPASCGEGDLVPRKGQAEEGPGKTTGSGPLAPRDLLPLGVPLPRWQRRLRRAARQQVLSGHLPFCRFRLRYPSLSPSTFWVWKSLARGWSRGLSKLPVPASTLGKAGQEAEAAAAGRNVTALAAHPAGASKHEEPAGAQEGPSREGATVQGQLHSESPRSHPLVATGSGSGQMLVMDVIATTKFKAQAKLFLQKRFQSKSFPSYKEFRTLFPLTARSTYYMWKRALYDGLTLVDG